MVLLIKHELTAWGMQEKNSLSYNCLWFDAVVNILLLKFRFHGTQMNFDQFRSVAVLGRGHFGKVSSSRFGIDNALSLIEIVWTREFSWTVTYHTKSHEIRADVALWTCYLLLNLSRWHRDMTWWHSVTYSWHMLMTHCVSLGNTLWVQADGGVLCDQGTQERRHHCTWWGGELDIREENLWGGQLNASSVFSSTSWLLFKLPLVEFDHELRGKTIIKLLWKTINRSCEVGDKGKESKGKFYGALFCM